MKSILILSAAVVCFSTLSSANTPKLPIYPISGTFSPNIDENGFVRPIFALVDLNLGRGLGLPLVLNYSSDVRPPSPELGQGWDCPLFDAKIFDVQPNLKKIELLGGRTIYLAYDSRQDRWKHVFSNHWTGRTEADDFILSYDSVYEFVFHKGVIASLIMPNGRTIVWERDGRKLLSLGEEGKAPALRIVYDKLGFATKFELNPDSAGNSSRVVNLTTDLVHAAVNGIECIDGRKIALQWSNDTSNNPILSWTDTRGLPETMCWDQKNGRVLSDNDFKYTIDVASDDQTPKMARVSKITGKTETFYFDSGHGTMDETLSDGTAIHLEMSQAPGPNYKKVRLIQKTVAGKTQTVLRRSFDEQGHLLLEAMGLANGKEVVRQYAYDDAGRVESYIWNGKEMWKNTYDAAGNVSARELPNIGVRLAFEQLPGGNIKETIARKDGPSVVSLLAADEYWQKMATMELAQ